MGHKRTPKSLYPTETAGNIVSSVHARACQGVSKSCLAAKALLTGFLGSRYHHGMRHNIIVVTDGKHYKELECVEGQNPEGLIEGCPGYFSVGTADSSRQAKILIESDRMRHTLDSL